MELEISMQKPSDSTYAVQIVAKLARQLGAYPGYLQQRNDIHSIDHPRTYLLSRCIDTFLTASMAFTRCERCRVLSIPENEDLCTHSSIARDVAADSEIILLAGIIRPCVEMYVDLLILGKDEKTGVSADNLCRLILYNHLAGDCEQKLAACQDTYGCSPSYFTAGASWYRTAVEKKRPELTRAGVNSLASARNKFVQAFASASHLDIVALGGDCFSSQAVLAYKLHFLPQKSVAHTSQGLEFFRHWCGVLLVLLGAKIVKAIGETIQDVDLSELEEIDRNGPTDTTNPNCPDPGDVVFFDWGVGRVDRVDRRPLGNEILFVTYDVAFVPQLKSPDPIPRRFLKCKLKGDGYEEVLNRLMASHEVKLPGELCAAASAKGSLLNVYMALYACRDNKAKEATAQQP